MRRMSPLLRLFAAAAALGLWLAFFFLGRTARGALHLLLLAALALLLWRPAARRQAAQRRPAPPSDYCRQASTGLARMPTPGISTSIRSPSASGPTPAGVPVRKMSPGSSVMRQEA